jgi:hypothetical protein
MGVNVSFSDNDLKEEWPALEVIDMIVLLPHFNIGDGRRSE